MPEEKEVINPIDPVEPEKEPEQGETVQEPDPSEPITPESEDPAQIPAEETGEEQPNQEQTDAEADNAIAEEIPPQEETAPESEEKPLAYRWTYEEQAEHDAKIKPKNSGLKIFIIVATSVFLVLLTLLVVTLMVTRFGNSYVNPNAPGVVSGGQIDAIKIAQLCNPGIVEVQATQATGYAYGTGFFFKSGGYILTNYHVVENALSVNVYLYSGQTKTAQIIGYSKSDDIAVLKVDGFSYPALTMGKSEDVVQGESIVVIGGGGGLNYGWTVTRGIVSHPSREVRLYSSDRTSSKLMKMVQFDATANSGNSGGPLINAAGEVIGMVTMKVTGSGSTPYDDMNFAIPSSYLLTMAERIIAEGNIEDSGETETEKPTPVLGVTARVGGLEKDSRYYADMDQGIVYDVFSEGEGDDIVYYYEKVAGATETETSAEPEKIPVDLEDTFVAGATGIMILTVAPGSGADGKLQPYDIVMTVAGIEVTRVEMVKYILSYYNPGDEVPLTVYRDGEVLDIKVQVMAP